MPTTDSTPHTTPPAGFEMIPDVQFHPDGTMTMTAPGSVHVGPQDLGTEIAIESFWRPGAGHFYTIEPLFERYSLEDLRTIRAQMDRFIHRAEQLDGGAR